MRRASLALIPSLFATALVVSLYSTGGAQTREKFIISARAGGVNAVTGRATMRPRGNSEWEQLTIKEDLETGDVVRTGSDGRVEMLLNPGSYMRIGENSEFELVDNSLENLEVRLLRGTAIVEATGADDAELLINITTPHTRLAIVRRGLYRLNVVPGDITELIVRKGRVMLGPSHTKVNGGNKVVFSSGSFLIAKLDKAAKKNLDNLEAWSKERAETVAQANRSIRLREISMVMAYFDLSRDFFYGSRGFWFFSPRDGCYTFMPFSLGWGSPYGSSYSNAYCPGYCGGPFSYGRPIAVYPSGSAPSRPSARPSSNPAGSSSVNPSRISPSPPRSSGPGSLPRAGARSRTPSQ
jgi:FecR-like protein